MRRGNLVNHITTCPDTDGEEACKSVGVILGTQDDDGFYRVLWLPCCREDSCGEEIDFVHHSFLKMFESISRS